MSRLSQRSWVAPSTDLLMIGMLVPSVRCARARQLASRVVRPPLDGSVAFHGPSEPIALGSETAGRDTVTGHERVAHGARSLLRECLVVLGRADVVGMALDRERRLGTCLNEHRDLLQHGLRLLEKHSTARGEIN